MSFEATEWTIRSAPLQPRAVLAEGECATELLHRLLRRSDEELARLRGVRSATGSLILAGESMDLPWSDGVVYLGRDDAAPTLLVPALLEPTLPIALLERALLSRFPLLAAPLAVVPLPSPRVFPVGAARPLLRRHLEQAR